MRYVLATVLVLIAFVTVLLCSTASVRFAVHDDAVRVTVRLLCFGYTFDSEKAARKKAGRKREKPTAQAPAEEKDIHSRIETLRRYYALLTDASSAAFRLLGALRHKIEISSVSVWARFGTGDAAATGMAYGAAWAVLGQLYVLLRQYFVFAWPQVELTPVFDKKCFSVSAQGIIRFRPVHIIKAALLGAALFARRQRG